MPGTPPLEDQLVDLFDRLRKLAFNQHPLESSSVTMPQLTLLDAIDAAPGCGIQELATGLDLSTPTISVSVRKLEDSGLVERRPDPNDGRAVQLFLTQRGQGLCQRARAFRRDKMRRLLRGLTEQEGATLATLLERAVRTAEQKAEPDGLLGTSRLETGEHK